jgi:transposase
MGAKRQVVQEYQDGETLHGLAKRHGISRNLVRIWAAKAEAGEFDDDLAAASILQEPEARRWSSARLFLLQSGSQEANLHKCQKRFGRD